MVAVPVVRTYEDYPSDESILDYAEWGASLFDVLEFVMRPPKFHAKASTGQAITSGGSTIINWNQIYADTHGFWSPTTSTKVQPTVPGWYKGWIGYSYSVTATGTSGTRVFFLRNQAGVNILKRENRAAFNAAEDQIFEGIRFIIPANGTTDWFTMLENQNSGGTINSNAQAGCQEKWPQFFMRWWKPL